MELTPVHLLSTEERLDEIARILLRGCQRAHTKKRRKEWTNNRSTEAQTGLRRAPKRPWHENNMED
jgi:hypothetical protein